jgi:hypothetical protein
MAGFKGGFGFTGNGDFFTGAGFLGGDDPGPGGRGRDSRLPLFAQGRSWDTAAPSTWLAMNMSDVSRPGPLDEATDDEALGILRKWRSLESWATSRKLALARELIRRHPMPGTDSTDTTITPGTDAGSTCLPAEWDPRLEREVSAALGISLVGAGKLLRLAWSLEARLPRVGKALHEDRLDLQRARTIVEETEVLLDPHKLAQAEEMILARLGKCKTYSDFLRMIQHAVITVDPEGAEKRRKLAEREQARVQFWRENSGACGLAGTGLPADEALRANAHIEARAQAYRTAGVKRYIDLLRVMAFLDILNDVPVAERVARCQAEDAERAAEQAAESAQHERDAKTRQAARDKAARMKARPGAPDGGTRDDGIPHGGNPDSDTPDGGMPEDEGRGPFGDYPPAEDPCSNCTLGNCPCRDLDPPEPPPCDDCGCGGCHCSTRPAGEGPGDSAPHDEAPDGADGGGGSGVRGRGPGDSGSGGDGSGPGGDSLGGRGPSRNGPGGGAPGKDSPVGPAGGDGHEACPECGRSGGVGLPILGNLTLPLETLLGTAERPGEAHGLGALDPGLVRDLARAGAGHPDSEFCVTITDEHGYAIGHGCCKPLKPRAARKRGKAGKSGKGPPNGPAPPAPAPPSPSPSRNPDRATFTRSGKPESAGYFGSWILTLPGAAYPFSVDIEPVPTYTCDHRHESTGHDPSDRLRHLLQVRDGKCSFVTCSRHARESDFEHATPYDRGGRTCGCNCHMCSRSCHRTKQSAGWSVTNPLPGFHQWTTGFGRTYTQAPWRYPS